ncbi:MAG: hypothetical protein H6911_01535 [Rickettsiaceae bacterium]|nr:hypothetical protein [Rickettsiaceae bacterium]
MEDINMKLVDSIDALDLTGVLSCLNSGADCNFKFKDLLKREHSIISIAIEKYLESSNEEEYRAAKDILGAILDKKPDLSITDKKGNTVLHKFFSTENKWSSDYVAEDKLNIMSKLIELGAPVDVANEKGELPIHFAATREALEAVKILEYNAPGSINRANASGETPLMVGIKEGKYLSPLFPVSMLKMGAIIKVGDKSALDIARETGKTSILKALKAFATETDEKTIETDTLTIKQLINYYNPEELSDLIEKSGLNVNIKSEEGVSLISTAINFNMTEKVKVLLQHGASLATGEYGIKHPLFILAMYGTKEMAEIVCTFAKPEELASELQRSNFDLASPIHIALQQGKIGTVKLFLEHGSDPKLKKEGEIIKVKNLKKLFNDCYLDNIKKSLQENHPKDFEKIPKKEYDSVGQTYGFEDIQAIDHDYQEIVKLAGADSSCLIA